MAKKKFLSLFVTLVLVCVAIFTLAACQNSAVVSISATGIKTDYVSGEKFSAEGLKITAVMDNKDKIELTASDVNLSIEEGAVLTENTTLTITLKANESIKATIKISVHNNVTELAVKTAPTKTEYWSGEEAFEAAGMVITATLENGDKKDITVATESGVSYSKDVLSVAGKADEQQEITVNYGGKSVKQAVTVKYNPFVKVDLLTDPTQTVYMAGDTFNVFGMTVKATRKSGTEATITLNNTNSSATNIPDDAAEGADVNVTVTFDPNGVAIEFPYTAKIASGIFIEAEDGLLNGEAISSSHLFYDAVYNANNSNPWDDHYLATGGAYVGDVKSGNELTFIFMSDKAGTGSIAFRLASQYLVADSSWTPLQMGDCQLNKISEVSVNGVKLDVSDSVILRGGGDGVTPNGYLWFNWDEVAIEGISFKEGENTIAIKFITHDYTNTSQSSFSGTFTANVDSLKVMSADCKLGKPNDINGISVTGVKYQDGFIVVDGTVNFTTIDAAAALEKIQSGLVYAYGTGASATVTEATMTGNSFTAKFPVSVSADGTYLVKFGYQTAKNITISNITEKSAVDGAYTYALAKDDSGAAIITLETNPDAAFELTAADIAKADVALENRNGVAYYIITGGTFDYNAAIYSDAQVEALLNAAIKAAYAFDLQCNNWNSWGRVLQNAHQAEVDMATKTFKIVISLASLQSNNGGYVTHFGKGSVADFTLTWTETETAEDGTETTVTKSPEDFTKELIIGNKKYEMIFFQRLEGENSEAQHHTSAYYFNCVGIHITEVEPSLTINSMPARGDNTYAGLTGTYTTINGDQALTAADFTVAEEDGWMVASYQGLSAALYALNPAEAPTAQYTNIYSANLYDTNASIADYVAPAEADFDGNKLTVKAGTAVRVANFFMVPGYGVNTAEDGTKTPMTYNIGHNANTTVASGIFGTEFVWTMDIQSAEDFTLMLFATNGVTTTAAGSNSNSSLFVTFKDNGTIVLGGAGSNMAQSAALSVAYNDFKFSATESNEITIAVTRVDASNFTIKLFVNGKQVMFPAASANSVRVNDEGYLNVTTRGHGPRLNVVAGESDVVVFAPANAFEGGSAVTKLMDVQLTDVTLAPAKGEELPEDIDGQIKLEVRDGKVYYIITGTYAYTKDVVGYTDEEVEAYLTSLVKAAIHFDLQENPYAYLNTWSGNWTTRLNGNFEVTLNDDGTLEVAVDLSSLPNYYYTTHSASSYHPSGDNSDFKPTQFNNFTQSVTLNGKLYTMIYVNGSNDGAEYWGCVGLQVEDAPAEETPVETPAE